MGHPHRRHIYLPVLLPRFFLRHITDMCNIRVVRFPFSWAYIYSVFLISSAVRIAHLGIKAQCICHCLMGSHFLHSQLLLCHFYLSLVKGGFFPRFRTIYVCNTERFPRFVILVDYSQDIGLMPWRLSRHIRF